MHLKLRNQQIKAILGIYRERLLYQNHMITTNQKSTIDTRTQKKNNPNTTLKIVIRQQEKRAKEEGKKNLHNTHKNITMRMLIRMKN